jgi:hypothetical protein
VVTVVGVVKVLFFGGFGGNVVVIVGLLVAVSAEVVVLRVYWCW